MRRIAVIAALLLLCGPASAQDYSERITSYSSGITVEKNGQLDVVETIAVVAAGEQIRHGIYRDFPTKYTNREGVVTRVTFDVTDVTRDGQDEPYTTEHIDNGVRVKIGSADTEVEPGPHIYRISYITTRQIGFFDTYDELYWNVTGTGWIFPIEHAEALIHLPPGTQIKQTAFYTGAQGDSGDAAVSHLVSDSDIRFDTTAPLGPHEGLTVAVGFAKGAIAPPSEATKRAEFVRDNANLIVVALGVLVLLVFYSTVWWEYGRDPAQGTIIPLFAPPENFSPEAVRFVHRMAYDRKSFAAALINMAVKGYLKIRQEGSDYTLELTGKSENETSLASGERAMARGLFGGGAWKSIELKQSNHNAIANAISGLKTSLRNEYETKYFVTNSGWFVAGLAILILTGIGGALLSDQPETSGFLLLWLSGWSVATAFLLHRAGTAWSGVIYGPGSRFVNFFGALFMSAFALPFLAALVFALFTFGSVVSPIVMALLAIGGAAAYVFYHLLKAPTALGARTRDQIEGFRIFLNTAEKERLEYLHPPNVTPEVFEKFLPYAIALDCENAWSKKFEAEAAAAAANSSRGTPYGGYAPIWYSGNSFDRLGAGGFASAIGASLATSAAAASTAPGSSSGSGGGGFSGGGGGGGGGGGW